MVKKLRNTTIALAAAMGLATVSAAPARADRDGGMVSCWVTVAAVTRGAALQATSYVDESLGGSSARPEDMWLHNFGNRTLTWYRTVWTGSGKSEQSNRVMVAGPGQDTQV